MCPGLYTILVFLAIVPPLALAQRKSTVTLAATPPMGWNSWNCFAEKVTDKDVRQAADLLVSYGIRDASYVYVNIDDIWGARDTNENLHSNDKFPDMKALSDYVHSKGLKIDIYSSPGPKTCARFEGSMGHEDQDKFVGTK
jgi:alpha-galactosidase